MCATPDKWLSHHILFYFMAAASTGKIILISLQKSLAWLSQFAVDLEMISDSVLSESYQDDCESAYITKFTGLCCNTTEPELGTRFGYEADGIWTWRGCGVRN